MTLKMVRFVYIAKRTALFTYTETSLSGSAIISFYYRRLKRILPLYGLFILSTVVFCWKFFDEKTFGFNFPHVVRSLFFVSNLQQENDNLSYERMILSAQILFTHSWSLSVEVQFYLIAPFILLAPKIMPRKFILALIGTVSYAGFTYYLNLKQTRYFAFNSMFTRMWQFIVGSLCYLCYFDFHGTSQSLQEEEIPLFVKESNGLNDAQPPIVAQFSSNLLLISIIFMCFYPADIPVHLIRACACLQTAGLIFTGRFSPNWFLTTRPVVYLGNISYSMYLIHWPICAFLKQNELNTPVGSIIGMATSILLAIFITETYEKWYLKQDKGIIITLCAVLYITSLVVLWSLAPGSILKTDNYVEVTVQTPARTTVATSNYSVSSPINITTKASTTQTKRPINDTAFYWRPKYNISKEEVIQLNLEFTATDTANLYPSSCNYTGFESGATPADKTLCDVQNADFTGNKTVMMIGNSYTQNIMRMQMHVEECERITKKMWTFANPGCEVLEDSTPSDEADLRYCEGWNQVYLEAVKHFKPDILFITVRHIASMMPNKTETDELLGNEKKRLSEIEKFVNEKVFIFDALPKMNFHLTSKLNNGIRTGQLPSQESLIEKSSNYQLARSRMASLAKECTKCELLDVYPSLLSKNGTYQFYDPSNGIAYFADGRHFTDHGLEKIRPVYVEKCRQFM